MVERGFIREGKVEVDRRKKERVIDREKDERKEYLMEWELEEVKKVEERLKKNKMIVRKKIERNIKKEEEEQIEFKIRKYGKEYKVQEEEKVVIENEG